MQNTFALWLRDNIGLLALLLVVGMVYMPSLSGEFVIDDVVFIKDNPYIKDVSHIGRFFTKGLWENSALEVNTEAMYRPMNLLPMVINHAIWGENPFGYHIFVVFLHLLNTCLVYVLVRKLANSSVRAALLGAALFALHPVRVESVAWISGEIDPLVTLFLLGALWAHLCFVADGGRQWWYGAVSIISFQLALWSKEVAIIFPFIVIACDWLYRRKIHGGLLVLHGVVIGIYLIMRNTVLGSTGKWSDLSLAHFSKVPDFVFGYGEMFLFPLNIPLYIQPPEHAVSSGWGIVSVLVQVLLLIFCWKYFAASGKKAMAFAIFWMIAMFWPAVLLMFYTNGFYAARFLYVPALGMAIIAALLFDYLKVTYPQLRWAWISAGVVLTGCNAAITWKDIPAWHDAGTIYGKVAQDAPENSVGFLGLGYFYMSREDYANAERNFLIALEKSKTPEIRTESLVNLGTINGMNNHLEQSEMYLQEAVAIDPKNSQGWTGLGNLAQMKGDYQAAMSYYEKAIASNPNNYEATLNLADVYEKTGLFQNAEVLRHQAKMIAH